MYQYLIPHIRSSIAYLNIQPNFATQKFIYDAIAFTIKLADTTRAYRVVLVTQWYVCANQRIHKTLICSGVSTLSSTMDEELVAKNCP